MVPTRDIDSLADDYFAHLQRDSGLWNTARGDLDTIEAWEDFSAAGLARRLAVFADYATRAESLRAATTGIARTLTTSIAFNARSMAVLLPAWAQLQYV